jgi:tetratricopeptide (TPR) repeat protein
MTAALSIVVVLATLAAEGSSPAPAPAGEQSGRAHFARAEAKFNVGRFAEALADYRAAYEAEPLPAFLFNIGQCYRNTGDYDSAAFYFRRYTALDPDSPNRPVAERLIVEMTKLADLERQRRSERSDQGPDEPRPAPQPGQAPGPLAAAPSAAPPVSSASVRASAATGPPAFAPALPQGGAEASASPSRRTTWLWIGLAAAAAGGVAVALMLTSADDPSGTLPSIDARAAR